MKDYAQATTDLINAAIKVAELVAIKSAFPLEGYERECLKILKIAVEEYQKTSRSNRVADDEDFDSLHGAG